MILTDAVEIAGVRETRDGYWIADVFAAKGGNVQRYAGYEVGRPGVPFVDVYRPRDEVFRPESLASYAHKPVCVGHPRQNVTTATWRDVAAGTVGGDIVRDGDRVRVSLALMDEAAIEAVRDGVREVSMGYDCRLEFADGVTEDGTPYQAVQHDIRINHAAIVPKARGGNDLRIGDGERGRAVPIPPNKETRPMPDENNGRAVILDGLTVRTNDAGAEAIQRLQTQITDARTASERQTTEHRTVLDGLNGQLAAARQALADATAAKDGEIAGLRLTHQTALDALNQQIVDLQAATQPAALEAMASARAAVIGVARRWLGDAFTGQGMADAEIRKQTVVKAMGATLVDADSKPPVFFDSVFEVVAAQPAQKPATTPDPVRAALANGAGAQALADAQREPTPYEKHVSWLTSAYRNPAAVNGGH